MLVARLGPSNESFRVVTAPGERTAPADPDSPTPRRV